MAAGALFDLSGQTQYPSLPSGTKDSLTSSNVSETGNVNTSSTSSKAFSGQNTPQSSLDALKALITQLSDHPAVSQADALKQFPDLQTVYTQNGWMLQDPLTGQMWQSNDPAAKKLQLERNQQRDQLISQGGTITGGTAETKVQGVQRQTEITRNREQQSQYSKDAAFADAAALQGRFTRQLLEQLMPNIRRAVDASGTTGGAVSGLMAQDAAARTAEAQAALGLQAAGQYGQIYDQLASTLELLTRSDTPTTNALLQALNISKGTINVGTEVGTVNTSQTSTGTKDLTGTDVSTQQGTKPTAPAVTPLATMSPALNTGPQSMIIENTTDKTMAALIASLNKPTDAYSKEYQF